MNQADIETFLMLVKTQSITKTAENLFVSQPTVSHRLKLLEEELGVSLMIRKKGYKKVELTNKGEEFIPIAQRWLSLMKETMLLKSSGEEMFLSIGSTDTLNSCILRDVYRYITHQSSLDLKLNISTHYSNVLYELLENHTINEVTFIWETNYQIWHEQMISTGRRSTLEVDTYSLFSEFLKEKGKWAVAPVTVVNRLKQDQDVFVSEIGDRKKPPERITYIIRHKDINEAKLNTLRVFEDYISRYFTESGLDSYMDRYTDITKREFFLE